MLRNISVIMENIENTNLVDDMECPICYDFMGGQIVVCQEGHSICQECYREMQKIKKCFCPICYGQILTRRNITLEKVSSKIKTLLEIKNNAVISREMSNKNYVEKEDFNCPEECGFCTDRLINLRVHLNQLHPTQITRIKCESPTIAQFKLIFLKQKETSRFLFSLWRNIYVIYVKKCNDTYKIYVSVVSNEKTIYRYKIEYSKNYKICHFYKDSSKLYDYLPIFKPKLIVKKNEEKYFTQIIIEKIGIL